MTANESFLGTGYVGVSTQVSCVITRFEVRSFWALVAMFWHYRQIVRETRALPGLLQSRFLVDGLRSFLTLSIWKDDTAILNFNLGPAHIRAANRVLQEIRVHQQKAVLWSAQFRLVGISDHNMQWPGMEDVDPLAEAVRRRGCITK